MKHILVKEIMIPTADYTTIKETATVKDAITAFQESFFVDEKNIAHGHRSLLVINDEGQLVGILTIRSILQALVISQKDSDLSKEYLWIYLITELQKSAADIPVKKVMRSSRLASVKINDDIMKVVKLMVKMGINSVPVTDKGKVVGVVRGIDVFKTIGELF